MTMPTATSPAGPEDFQAGGLEDDELAGNPAVPVPGTADEPHALPGMRVRVTLEDGREFVSRVTNRDYIAWDRTAPRKKWGKGGDVPFLFASFLAWNAARRDGLFDGTFDGPGGFVDVAEDVATIDQEVVDDEARPTRRAAGRA